MKFRKGDVVRHKMTASEGVVAARPTGIVGEYPVALAGRRDVTNLVWAKFPNWPWATYCFPENLELVKRKPRVIKAVWWPNKRGVPAVCWGVEMPDGKFAPFGDAWEVALTAAIETATEGRGWFYTNYERIAR